MIDATRFASFLFLFALFQSSCTQGPTTVKSIVEVVAVSTLPDPRKIPYPHAAAVCHCRNERGEPILVAIPALQDRKLVNEFKKVKVGSRIAIQLIPWEQRPAPVRAMFIANDFTDLYDLPLYFGQFLGFP